MRVRFARARNISIIICYSLFCLGSHLALCRIDCKQVNNLPFCSIIKFITMYRKKFVKFRQSADLEPFDSVSYKPFSHFVLGGCDITGEHTALTNPTVFDNPNEVPDFSAPSPLTSPRCGIMELSEFVGAERAKKMAESKDE